jgi:hypothetical protein
MTSLKRHIQECANVARSEDRRVKPKLVQALCSALDVHTVLHSLSKSMTNCESRVTVDEAMEMSESLEPSLVFGCGGFLMDFFILSKGTITSRRELCAATNSGSLDPTQMEDLKLNIVRLHKARWMCWLLRSMHGISQKQVTNQLFYITLLCDCRGLSRTGRSTVSKTGALLANETYRQLKLNAVSEWNGLCMETIQAIDVVWWYDNYAHFLKRVIISAEKSSFASPRYTGNG